MKLTVPIVNDLPAMWEKAREGLNTQLDNLVTSIRKGWQAEHNVDGTHADITAESINLSNAPVGAVESLPYNAARFIVGAGGGTWTVGSDDYVYMRVSRVGQLGFLQFGFYQTSLATATASTLHVLLPEIHAIPQNQAIVGNWAQLGGQIDWNDADGSGLGVAYLLPTAGAAGASPTCRLVLAKVHTLAGAASALGRSWQIGANNITINGFCWFLVEPDNTPKSYFG